MPFTDAVQDSVSTIIELLEMGLHEQAQQLYRSAVRQWGNRSELANIRELIKNKYPSSSSETGKVEKYCPLCGSTFEQFSPLPDHFVHEMLRNKYKYLGRGEMTSIDEYECPVCGASDRERLYALWIETAAIRGRFKDQPRMVHFAPELQLSSKIKSTNIFSEYRSADLNMPDADFHVDLTDLPWENESFGFFICSHVLEHVGDDNKAIAELFRITKRGGSGILMVPIVLGAVRPVEGTGGETPEDRWRLFGQDDHVRLYTHEDFVSKVGRSGFHLLELGMNYFSEETFERLGLLQTSILYVVEKW